MWLCFSAPKTADACEEPSPQPYAVPSFNLRSQSGHSAASSQHGTLRSTPGPAQQQPTQRASTSAPESHERTSSHHDTAASGQSPGGSPLEGHGQASPSTHDSGAKTIGNDAFGVELCRVLIDASSSGRSKDIWGTLQRTTELVVQHFGYQTVGIIVYTESKNQCKVVCNSTSPLLHLASHHPDLVPSSLMALATQTIISGRATVSQDGDEAWARLQQHDNSDFSVMVSSGTCKGVAAVPLHAGSKAAGVVLLGHTEPINPAIQHSWLPILVSVLSVFVADSQVVKNMGLVEKVVECYTLHALAYMVTSGLHDVFDWCRKDGIETRLVVLSQDPGGEEFATVYCKLAAGTGLDEHARNALMPALRQVQGSSASAGSLASPGAVLPGSSGVPGMAGPYTSSSSSTGGQANTGSAASSRVAAALEDGLVGTQMSLDNTLTKRCLTGRQRLLFVADVVQALKLYSEPWKDIFMDAAQVLTPCWVLAAPLVHESKRLGAIIWVSSCRVSPEMLMRTASSYTSPAIHAVTRSLLRMIMANASLPDAVGSNGPQASMAAPMTSMSSYTALSSRMGSSMPSSLRLGGHLSAMDDPASANASHETGMHSSDVPVKYIVRHSPSTSALMHLYKSSIAQRSSPMEDEVSASAAHEVRVLSKAGEGAFGAVYVGRWRNMVVAVKIIKDNSGSRSLKTAWELAVNKSLTHPSIVTVHAILTDVNLQKVSPKVLRFIPAAPSPALALAEHLLAHAAAKSQSSTGGAGGLGLTALHNALGLGSPLRAGGVHTGPGGSGLQQSFSGPITNALTTSQSVTGTCVAGEDIAGSLATSLSAASATSVVQLPKVHALIMEYCNLGGLHRYIDERKFFRDQTPLPKGAGPPNVLPPECLHMDFVIITLMEVASALQYLHSQGFVHCDLKPENVLLKEAPGRRGFSAKLADFGLSELRTSDGHVVGDLGGTVTHVAPESVLYRQVSPASDIYAFGILMWELYTGQQPYRTLLAHVPKREERHRALLSKVVHEGVRPVFPDGAPPEYTSLAQVCWSADVMRRPSTLELIAELEAVMVRYGLPRHDTSSAADPASRQASGGGAGVGGSGGGAAAAAGSGLGVGSSPMGSVGMVAPAGGTDGAGTAAAAAGTQTPPAAAAYTAVSAPTAAPSAAGLLGHMASAARPSGDGAAAAVPRAAWPVCAALPAPAAAPGGPQEHAASPQTMEASTRAAGQ